MFTFNIEENQARAVSVSKEAAQGVARIAVVSSLAVRFVRYNRLILSHNIALHNGRIVCLWNLGQVSLLKCSLILLLFQLILDFRPDA
jgi:hypothetical protein